MILEPILKAKLKSFKTNFDCSLPEDQAFERFVNWLIIERHQPKACTGDSDLLDCVSVGGENDTGIDGLAIKVNGVFIKSVEEAKHLTQTNTGRIDIDFIFIQSKNKNKFKVCDYNLFLSGVKDFISTEQLLPHNQKIDSWLEIKDYLLGEEESYSKWDKNPSIYVYYVFLGDSDGSKHIKAADLSFKGDVKRMKSYDECSIEHVNALILKNYCDDVENNFTAYLNVLEQCSFFGENESIEGVGSNSTIAICRGSELIKLLSTEDGLLRRSIFEDNVRDYQGKTAINNEMIQTIKSTPSKFVLYNNGITIVCSELIVNGKRFILKNPQIVNGCQTCNVLYDVSKLQDSNDLLGQVKVILKIIATSNDTLVNNVVRGTNKQNIVQDEAFETIRGFHKNLEEFFISANELYKMPVALYYERRAKQYDNSKIKEIQKVTFSSLIRSFIAIFLSLPHKGVNHPASLLKEFTGKIFIDTQSLLPYYVAPQVNYFIDKVNKTSNILGKSKKYKQHIEYLFVIMANGFIPSINNAKEIDEYCKKIIELVKNESEAICILKKAIQLFSLAQEKWIIEKGEDYKHGIKDTEAFTEYLKKFYSQSEYNCTQSLDSELPKLNNRGLIVEVKQNIRGKRYGFINNSVNEKIYFNKLKNGNPLNEEIIGEEVFFDLITSNRGLKAVNVEFVSR